jgi:hypothetical protein
LITSRPTQTGSRKRRGPALPGLNHSTRLLRSASLAYRGEFPRGGVSITEIASGREPVLLGLRGARATAAAWAAGWAALFLVVVLGPYRRGDVAAWWGILVSGVVLALVVLARVSLIGVRAGIGGPLVMLAIVVIALLLDVRRLSRTV